MTEKPIGPTTQQPVPGATPEPAVTPVPEPAPAVDSSPFAAEEPETEVEAQDEEKLEQAENQFDDLDEELVDVHESADTIWLLRRVGIGLLKTILILGGIGLLVWMIWGDNKNIRSELNRAKDVNMANSVGKIKDKLKDIVPDINSVDIFDTPETTDPVPAETTTLPVRQGKTIHGGGLNLASWNYWMESQRMRGQVGTPGDVMRWKRDAETLFEIPFPDQISGANSITRSHNISRLLEKIESLLLRANFLQNTLQLEIADFSGKSNYAQELSLIAEQQFINAMSASDPTNIGTYLNQKADAEKDVQRHAVAAEGRRIFSQKILSYTQVLTNVQTAVTVNRQALEQNIQVVGFPADPFQRVIPMEQWTP